MIRNTVRVFARLRHRHQKIKSPTGKMESDTTEPSCPKMPSNIARSHAFFCAGKNAQPSTSKWRASSRHGARFTSLLVCRSEGSSSGSDGLCVEFGSCEKCGPLPPGKASHKNDSRKWLQPIGTTPASSQERSRSLKTLEQCWTVVSGLVDGAT